MSAVPRALYLFHGGDAHRPQNTGQMIRLNIACHAHHNIVDDDFYGRTSNRFDTRKLN